MASYVARHTKKRERLLRLEQELLRSVRSGASLDDQLRLAEEVRLAMIRVLRSERATFVPRFEGCDDRVAALDARIASLEGFTSDEILAEFVGR